MQLLLQIHLGDLAGEVRFQLIMLRHPFRKALPVGLWVIRTRIGERLLRNLRAQPRELAQLPYQSGVSPAQDGVALCGERLGAKGLAAQDQVKRGTHR